jgi:hypothetical protein
MMKSVQNFISYLQEFSQILLTFYLFLLCGNLFSEISKNWNFADTWGPPIGLCVATCRVPISQLGRRPSITEWPVIKGHAPTVMSAAAVRTPPPSPRVSTATPCSSPKPATTPHSFPRRAQVAGARWLPRAFAASTPFTGEADLPLRRSSLHRHPRSRSPREAPLRNSAAPPAAVRHRCALRPPPCHASARPRACQRHGPRPALCMQAAHALCK